jgi:carboxylesterase
VLLLHGFTGSPWEVRPLAESLAERGFFVRVPLLPGHGSIPEDLLWVTWREWLSAAQDELLRLAAFPRVCVGGLSMGALLSLLLAQRFATRIDRLLLMAPVMRVRQRSGRLLKALGRGRSAWLSPLWVKKHTTDLQRDEARERAPVLSRYPVTRLFDLFELQELARDAAPHVRTRALIIASVNDHVVEPSSIAGLHRAMPASKLLLLQRGFHIIPQDVERARVAASVADFFDEPAHLIV